MAMTSANNVTNAVMKATGELQGKIDVSKIEMYMLKYHIQVPISNNKNRYYVTIVAHSVDENSTSFTMLLLIW